VASTKGVPPPNNGGSATDGPRELLATTAWKSHAKLLSVYAVTAAVLAGFLTLSKIFTAIPANAQNPIATATKTRLYRDRTNKWQLAAPTALASNRTPLATTISTTLPIPCMAKMQRDAKSVKSVNGPHDLK